jgi:hypothetical protein
MDWTMWPQFAVAGLFMMSMGVSFENHGKPRTGKANVGIDIVAVSLVVWLLYMGGFWS